MRKDSTRTISMILDKWTSDKAIKAEIQLSAQTSLRPRGRRAKLMTTVVGGSNSTAINFIAEPTSSGSRARYHTIALRKRRRRHKWHTLELFRGAKPHFSATTFCLASADPSHLLAASGRIRPTIILFDNYVRLGALPCRIQVAAQSRAFVLALWRNASGLRRLARALAQLRRATSSLKTGAMAGSRFLI